MKLILIILVTIATTGKLVASLPMGQWRTHLAYNIVNQIAQSPNRIFAVSEGALFSVHKQDGDIEFYSKMSGLNDSHVTNIAFDTQNNQLLIVYQNGNIDIMLPTGIMNIPDLMLKQMSAGKRINHVFFRGNFAYLSTNFGILVLNMLRREIADTYIIGPQATEVNVLSTLVHNDRIMAVTQNSIFSADIQNPNLVNFAFWTQSTSFPGSGNFQDLFSFNGSLFLLRNNTLFKQENDTTWTPMLPGVELASGRVSNGVLIFSDHANNVHVFNEQMQYRSYALLNSPDVEYDPQHTTFWLAGGSFGVMSLKVRQNAEPLISYFKPSGPAVNIPWDMTFSGEKLFVVNGGRWANQFKRPGVIMMYENNRWTNLIATEAIEPHTQFTVIDLMNVAVNPNDNSHFFVTAYGSGLYEFRNNAFHKWYNHLNSPLYTIIPSIPLEYIRLEGAIFDKDNNLFMMNMDTGNGIKILLNNGEWTDLYFPNASQETFGKILISNQNPNQKWVPSLRRRPGMFIWDDNGTLTDQSDDKSIFLTRFPDVDNVGSFITPSNFFCIAQDKNGVIWAGTDMGPLLFYNPNRAFEAGYTASRVKIPRNDGTGLADFLLQNERVKAIAIDGANRKWLGTESSGLYLMSENGQETIKHFTTTNSPLLSNNILSLAINPVSGELFVGTSAGLISYQSNAAEAGATFNNVHVFPNPVRENFNGIITITGLVENTRVKITDLNGHLIYQTISNGSIATWDGKDLNGRKVRSGIYLAICASEDGSKSTITKIMVIH